MKAALDVALLVSKNLKPVVATAWKYAKVEMIPPLTSHIFQGAFGARLENAASSASENFIRGLEQKLNAIEAERVRAIKEKEAAVKAAAEKAKAEALKKAEEQKRAEAQKAADSAKAQKAKEEAPKTGKKADPKKKKNPQKSSTQRSKT
ncbi:unnamed protein product [Leptosia nina]|uniref:Uncharacterized protein n=1 Tax=Leptosia nina TaxID=320188 RepID=A0AAV1JIG9_9NEOP